MLDEEFGRAGPAARLESRSAARRAQGDRALPAGAGIHGHIHESRGTFKLGKTLCINPGSEYTEGILRGSLIELRGGKVRSQQLTAG